MQVAEAHSADVDRVVKAARKAFDEGTRSKILPSDRSKLLWKLAELLEKHSNEFAEIESIDNGKPVAVARAADVLGRRGPAQLHRGQGSNHCTIVGHSGGAHTVPPPQGD